MQSSDDIRRQVSEAYTGAVSQATSKQASGCCGGDAIPGGVAAQLAGYSTEELRSLPTDAVTSSFGCGNPLALSGVEVGDTVLDLGSGAGIDVLLAAKLVGPTGKAIGIDMTDEMISRATKNADAAGVAGVVDIRKGIIEELPVESASVDWVISNCVINLSPEKQRVFAEIARVLKPGGQMLVSDIVATELPDWVTQSDAMYSACIAGAIDEDSYLQGLRDAGLREVAVRERLVYDEAQIAAFMVSDEAGCCGTGGPVDSELSRQLAGSLTGKVWSAKIYGQK